MEGKLETNATQNFGHQSGLWSVAKNGLKTSTNMLSTSEKLQHGPQQHFLDDVRLGCCQSQCSILPGGPEAGGSQGLKTVSFFCRANTNSKLVLAN